MPKQPERVVLEDISEDWLEKNIVKHDGKLYTAFREVVDVLVGLVGFLILLLLLPLLFIAIKIDSKGSILFYQERIGKNKRKFFLYKLRTMYQEGDGQMVLWREKNRDSITRVGKFLRRTHLDELPQCINLLRGEVSFVGPRAEWSKLGELFEKEIPFYQYRYLVKPGIIGWAQINMAPSRSVEEAKKKFEFDLYYIVHRSISLDVEIILKSFKLFRW